MRFALISVIFFLVGCATGRQNPPTLDACYAEIADGIERHSLLRDELAELAENREEPTEVLLLSGGGRNGAFGSGVLAGWREHATAPRPEKFHVVTGVSTGALMANFAFLGRRKVPFGDEGEMLDGDELLFRAYTTVRNEDILSGRFLPRAVLFKNALNDATPFESLLRTYVSDAVIDAIAEEGRHGRRLFVGTTNLDCGRFVIWDMVAMAQKGDYDRYRQIVQASASVPLIFPPVEIDGFLHADGGVREQLFVDEIFRPIAQRLRRIGTDLGRKFTIHVLVNGTVGVEPTVVDGDFSGVGARAVLLLLDECLIKDLVRAERAARDVGADFRLMAIPREDLPEGDITDFDPVVMKSLYLMGVAQGAKGRWKNEVGRLRTISGTP